jgi:integrase
MSTVTAPTASSVSAPSATATTPGCWEQVTAVAPRMAATIGAYLAELSAKLAPRTVAAVDATLRHFAGYVVAVDPDCTAVASITGRHVGDWCAWLAVQVDPSTGQQVSASIVNDWFGEVCQFFEHLADQQHPDTPTQLPVPARPRRPRRSMKPQVPPWRRQPGDASWEEITRRAPQMAATMTTYLEQLAVSSRPGTVEVASLALRQFASHLVRTDSACTSVAAIQRHHVESYKLALSTRPRRDGLTTVSTQTIRMRLGMLRTFFERVIEWDDPDAPPRVPVFAGDIPKRDDPLPKFLDDPAAAKFMAALAVEPDRQRRLVVELLARTGMRVGELGGLRDDAMYRLGDTWWLRIPVGKLHNDRTVPLHPMLVGLINDYRAWRGPTITGLLVERHDHQPMDRGTIYRHVKAVARRAGVRVHPHALRHTLATQCLNRGMRLEAIAALLGHRDTRMTLVYARISDTTVAEQYFAATRATEAPTAASTTGTTTDDDDTRDAARLHRRLLGNGHCTRPLELDCRFQTICEGCGFYETGPEFVTILRRQRDDATAHHDHTRTRLYTDLIDVIDDTARSQPGAGGIAPDPVARPLHTLHR